MSTLASLLHQFIDLFERDPSALAGALSEYGTFYTLVEDDESVVPLDEQIAILDATSQVAADEILTKTLVETSSSVKHHAVLMAKLEEKGRHQEGEPDEYGDLIEMLSELKSHDSRFAVMHGFPPDWSMKDVKTVLAEREGLSYEEYRARERRSEVLNTLASTKLRSQLLRYFANRIDTITEVVEGLDDTDFSRCVPQSLVPPFRELHVNAVLGNYGTVAILCGAVLEKALQDLLPSNGALKEVIEEAKRDGLLVDHSTRFAYRIASYRNDIVHGRLNFDALNSDEAWELVSITRNLIKGLYQSRLEEDSE